MINGAAKEIGRAAVVAVTKARGMEVAGAVDTYHVGEDIGKVFWLYFGVINFSCINAKPGPTSQSCVSNLSDFLLGMWHGRAPWNTHTKWPYYGLGLYISGNVKQ